MVGPSMNGAQAKHHLRCTKSRMLQGAGPCLDGGDAAAANRSCDSHAEDSGTGGGDAAGHPGRAKLT